MSGDVMPDPPAENITGEKRVVHHFTHGIDWKVNVSHVLAAVAVLAVAYYLFGSSSEESESDQDGVEAASEDGGLGGFGGGS